MHAYRTHTCAEPRPTHVGETIRVSGWVQEARSWRPRVHRPARSLWHGAIVTEVDGPVFKVIEACEAGERRDSHRQGAARAKAAVNPNLPTGEVEIRAEDAVVCPPPLNCRFRSRRAGISGRSAPALSFLDLRRETLHANIVKRTKIISDMRRRMEGAGFTEYSTPILTGEQPRGRARLSCRVVFMRVNSTRSRRHRSSIRSC